MILDFYLARKFLWTFLGMFFVFMVLLGLIDLVDELQDFPDLPFAEVVRIVLLNMPQENYEFLPLVLILSSVALFMRLARSSELVVVRSAGRSALRGLLAPLTVALLIGMISVTMLNPIVAGTAKLAKDVENSHAEGGTSILALSSEGLWLRQGGPTGQTVIHSERASSDLDVLFDTTFISFSPDGEPLRRITARRATLGKGEWHVTDAKIWDLTPGRNAEAAARRLETLSVPSELTRDRIVDSFGKPEYIPIWDLPDFISQLEGAGFSARRYAVWFQMEVARPIYLMALVVMTAAFTMRHARLSNAGVSVLSAVLLGFGLHYIRNFAQVLGENGQIPVMLAAWAPPVAGLLMATGIFLHMEDG